MLALLLQARLSTGPAPSSSDGKSPAPVMSLGQLSAQERVKLGLSVSPRAWVHASRPSTCLHICLADAAEHMCTRVGWHAPRSCSCLPQLPRQSLIEWHSRSVSDAALSTAPHSSASQLKPHFPVSVDMHTCAYIHTCSRALPAGLPQVGPSSLGVDLPFELKALEACLDVVSRRAAPGDPRVVPMPRALYIF